jgi:hypothetical protein
MEICFSIIVATGLLLITANRVAMAETISLSGDWRFQLDPQRIGEDERLYSKTLRDQLKLPGSLQEQGFGNVVTADTQWFGRGGGVSGARAGRGATTQAPSSGAARGGRGGSAYPAWATSPVFEKYRQSETLRIISWLQPQRHYVGQAWYQRQIDVPATWADKRIVLMLERAHWGSAIWIDDRKVGESDALATPQFFDVTDFIKPGTSSRLTIRMDNSMIQDVGGSAHSVSDQTQTAWNGVVGRIELTAGPKTWLDDVQVYPNVEQKSARVAVRIGNRSGKAGRGTIEITARLRGTNGSVTAQVPVDWDVGGGNAQISVPLGANSKTWDEFEPNLYDLTAALRQDLRPVDQRSTTFGLREFTTRGTQFAINGRIAQLRGTVECCIFPLTGYPPTTPDYWRKIMAACKDYGLNHIRFHSWCPPEAAFVAADEAGIYLAPEVDEWSTLSARNVDFFARESARMLREYGNHPSFVMMSLGNESGANPLSLLTQLIDEWKKDPRRVYGRKSNSNGSISPSAQYYADDNWKPSPQSADIPIRYLFMWPPTPRGDYFYLQPPNTMIEWSAPIVAFAKVYGPKPLIAHEAIQRCSYPDINNKSKFTGSLTQGVLYIASDQLQERGMMDQAADFVKYSGLWQIEQTKEEIESYIRTEGIGGFQWLQLNDFTGQGGALVGVLDAFWDSKGYVDGKTFRRFCGPVVPLARMASRTWTNDQWFRAGIEVANYGAVSLTNLSLNCRIVDDANKELARQTLTVAGAPVGSVTKLGIVELDLSTIKAPGHCRLLVENAGAGLANDWSFWVYPTATPVVDTTGIDIVDSLTSDALAKLKAGGTVLLLPKLETIHGAIPPPFVSIYWDCPYTNGGESQTLGFITDPKHPAYARFPTAGSTDWQWADLLIHARPLILDECGRASPWPKEYRPLLQPIDDWNLNRKLALLAEAKIGAGKLMICAMDIATKLDKRPVARQFRCSLLSYVRSPLFNPSTVITETQLRGCFE